MTLFWNLETHRRTTVKSDSHFESPSLLDWVLVPSTPIQIIKTSAHLEFYARSFKMIKGGGTAHFCDIISKNNSFVKS